MENKAAKINPDKRVPGRSNNKMGRDDDADKSGTDTNSDRTEKKHGLSKFDKPAKEVDPDRTGIDIDSDRSEKENKSK